MITKYFTPGVVIQRLTKTPNGMGGWTEIWSTHLTVEALIRPLSGTERISAAKLDTYSTHRMYCEPCDITPKDRVLHNGQLYRVKFVGSPMKFLAIELEATENE